MGTRSASAPLCSSCTIPDARSRSAGMEVVVRLFYFSKYYEYLDTWLVRAKGRQPIYLQKYHHIGAAMTLAYLSMTGGPPSQLFAIFNRCLQRERGRRVGCAYSRAIGLFIV